MMEEDLSKPGGFSCNICLESELNEPVVTLCGHLYCWPCIYQWLHNNNNNDKLHYYLDDHNKVSQQHSCCPVCKAEISSALLVPLYGKSIGASQAESDSDISAVPPRPPPPKLDMSSCNNYLRSWGTLGVQPLIHGRETTPYDHGNATRVFGNADTGFLFPSYPAAGYRSPRMRRREIRAEKSLNRLCLFLLCCFIMCFLFF